MKKIVFGLMMTILFAACGTPAQKTKDPRTLTLRMGSNPVTLNAVSANGWYASVIQSRINDPLIEVDKDLNIKPCVAKSWDWKTVTKGKKTLYILTFHLRNDVYWHDGVQMTADDWKFTFDKIMDPLAKGFNKIVKFQGLVDWARAKDKFTFQIAYNQKFAPALMSWVDMYAIPKHIYQKMSAEEFLSAPQNRAPIGMGPYVFTKWENNKRILLSVNTNYWRKQPWFRHIEYRIINDDSVALTAFRRGDFDVYGFNPQEYIMEKEKPYFKKNYRIYTYNTFSIGQIAWNCSADSVFHDKKVRRAMTYALNRKTLAQKVYHGYATVISAPIYINSWAYDRNITPLPFDLQKAKALLAKSGWKDSNGDGILDKNGKPFRFEIAMGSGSQELETVALNLKQNLEKIGVEMTLHPMEWSALSARLKKRDFNAIIFGWSLDYDPDLYDIFHSKSIKNGLNYGAYSNPVLDKLIIKGRTTMNRAARQKLYYQMHRILNADQPYTALFCNKSIVAVRKNIEGVVVGLNGLSGYYPGSDEWYRKTKNKTRK